MHGLYAAGAGVKGKGPAEVGPPQGRIPKNLATYGTSLGMHVVYSLLRSDVSRYCFT